VKNTFHRWSEVDTLDIDAVTNLIVTGRKATEARPDEWLYPLIEDPLMAKIILDFGCGFGRNALGISNHSDKWSVTGYDNKAMLGRVPEFATINYQGKIPPNLRLVSDWDQLRLEKFDVIVCVIVLQHIFEDALEKYTSDFKQMTKRLIVTGRRFNDDVGNRSTWTILEEQGLIPIEFYAGHLRIPYTAEGDPHEHNTAIYSL